MKKLPDAEFDIMKVIWHSPTPIVGTSIVEKLNEQKEKSWTLQTVHTLLSRLENRGFLQSEKNGKLRFFIPLIKEEEYLQYETRSFVKTYYGGSVLNLVNAMYQDADLNHDEIEEMKKWLNQRSKKNE